MACFGALVTVDQDKLRRDTVQYIENFDATLWHDDPVRTILRGEKFGGDTVDTTDAFGAINGKQLQADREVVDQVIEHMQTFQSSRVDMREEMRDIETVLLRDFSAQLIGNQALDFHKQDGVTEIEESLEANPVEHALNDLLFKDELDGKVVISRRPALVGCVSNFSNFLDLCRKSLRNLELGIPIVILSRSNTTQHCYRWAELLMDQMAARGLDPGLVTYVACTIEEQRRIMAACSDSPLYLTGSRPVAAAIKELLPATFASTGGPNTMVATNFNADVEQATRWSLMIENSGQCTAMRHLVAPGVAVADIEGMLDSGVNMIGTSADSLRAKEFAGLFKSTQEGYNVVPGYTGHPSGKPLAYRVGNNFPEGIEEHWRQVYLDVTVPASAQELASDAYLSDLASWLTTEQPITLAVNGDDPAQDYPITMKLFESTAQVVYSVGTATQPALTCQARPQDGEVFGEFPPRHELSTYTKFPVIVPSSTPGYHTEYSETYLVQQAAAAPPSAATSQVAALAVSPATKGYVNTIGEYLVSSCGPKRGLGERTTLWGLQRPPLNGKQSFLRCNAMTSIDEAVTMLAPYYTTNAREQLLVSVDPSLGDVADKLSSLDGLQLVSESEADFDQRVSDASPWNIVHTKDAASLGFPLVDKLVSLLFPVGHIKSTANGDERFVEVFSKSRKWLDIRN